MRNKYIYSILSFIVPFIVYLSTVAPDVSFTDSGELAAVCTTLGVAHPTGYPLFTILGHFWTLIPNPFSNIYWLNIFASFLTALASFAFFNVALLLYEIIFNKKIGLFPSKKEKEANPEIENNYDKHNTFIALLISLCSALIFAFSLTVWSQANYIEVYPLHLLLMLIILWTILKATVTANNKNYYYLTAFLLGLSFSNHMTTILLIPPVFFLFLSNMYKWFEKPQYKNVLKSSKKGSGKIENTANINTNAANGFFPLSFYIILCLLFVLGLSLYLYLPLRASMTPEFNWGYVSRGFNKFLYHASGKQYQSWMFTGIESVKENIVTFIGLVPLQFAWIGFIPMFYGFYATYIKSRKLFWFLVIMFFTCLAYSVNYSIHDIDSYFLTSFVALMLFCTIGIFSLINKYRRLLFFAFAIPLFSLVWNYGESNKSNDYLVPEYTRILTDKLQPNALIISSQWDYFVSAFWYKQAVENYRNDIMIIDNELLRRTWYVEMLKIKYPDLYTRCEKEFKNFMQQLELFESGRAYDNLLIQKYYIDLINSFINSYYNERPIYITVDLLMNESNSGVAKNYEKVPVGFAFKLEKEQRVYPVNVDNIDISKLKSKIIDEDNHLEKGIMEIASINLTNIGKYALRTSQYSVADSAFTLALMIDKRNEHALNGLQQLLLKKY